MDRKKILKKAISANGQSFSFGAFLKGNIKRAPTPSEIKNSKFLKFIQNNG